MTHKDELEKNIAILQRNIESPILQCDPHIAMVSRNATRNNYDAFINNEISKEDLKNNNDKIGAVTRKFIDMCTCMREFK